MAVGRLPDLASEGHSLVGGSAYERPSLRVRSPGTRVGGRGDRFPRHRPALPDWAARGIVELTVGLLVAVLLVAEVLLVTAALVTWCC